MINRITISALFAVSFALLFNGCGGSRQAVVEQASLEPVMTEFAEIVTGSEQLTFGEVDNGLGNFHPNGESIIYQSYATGKWQLMELDLLDLSISQIHSSDANDENPVWLPDGESLLFVSDRNSGDEMRRDIYLFTPNDDIAIPLAVSEADDWYPIALNDEMFAYLSERGSVNDDPLQKPNVLLAQQLFSDVEPKIIFDTDQNISAPVPLPDGNYVVRTPDAKLGLIAENSGSIKVLTPENLRCGTPAYSNQNGWIVFSGSMNNIPGLYLFDYQTNRFQRISSINGEVRYPQFSPNGEWILFTQEVNGIFQLFRIQIRAI